MARSPWCLGCPLCPRLPGALRDPPLSHCFPAWSGEARLGSANALLHTVQDLGVVVGPAIGAVLLAVASPSVAFLANAGTFAISALLISRLRRRPSPAAPRRGAITHLSAGLRTARRIAFVVPLFVLVAMVELTYGAQTVQLVVYAKRSAWGPAAMGCCSPRRGRVAC